MCTVNKNQEEKGRKNDAASILLSLSPKAETEGKNVTRTGTDTSNKTNPKRVGWGVAEAGQQAAAHGLNPTCRLTLYSLQAKVVLFCFHF